MATAHPPLAWQPQQHNTTLHLNANNGTEAGGLLITGLGTNFREL